MLLYSPSIMIIQVKSFFRVQKAKLAMYLLKNTGFVVVKLVTFGGEEYFRCPNRSLIKIQRFHEVK